MQEGAKMLEEANVSGFEKSVGGIREESQIERTAERMGQQNIENFYGGNNNSSGEFKKYNHVPNYNISDTSYRQFSNQLGESYKSQNLDIDHKIGADRNYALISNEAKQDIEKRFEDTFGQMDGHLQRVHEYTYTVDNRAGTLGGTIVQSHNTMETNQFISGMDRDSLTNSMKLCKDT